MQETSTKSHSFWQEEEDKLSKFLFENPTVMLKIQFSKEQETNNEYEHFDDDITTSLLDEKTLPVIPNTHS